MSEGILSILIFLHLTGVAVWVGSQVLTAAAVAPALRRVPDAAARLEAMQTFTRLFGFTAWIAMLVIVGTGGIMVGERIDQVDAIFGGFYEARWGWIFSAKMTLWVVMIGLIGLHSFIVGPRLLDANRRLIAATQDGAEGADEAEVHRLRRLSMALSLSGLLVSLVVLAAGAGLGNHGYSFQLA